MNEIERYIKNLLNSIFNRIRFNVEDAADRKLQNFINQKMDKHDNTIATEFIRRCIVDKDLFQVTRVRSLI